MDPFRIFHGLSQALVGLALYYLWQLVPLNTAKKTDDDFPSDLHERHEPFVMPSRGMGRVMSTQDLPLNRLEYY